MGQNQPRQSDSLPSEGKGRGGISESLKDRASAKFQERTKNVVNPKAIGDGKSGNPGRPV